MAYTDHLTGCPTARMLFQEMAAPHSLEHALPAGARPRRVQGRQRRRRARGRRPAAGRGGPPAATPSSATTTWSPASAATSSPSWSPARWPRPRRSPQRVVDALALPHRVDEWTFADRRQRRRRRRSALAGGQLAFREADAALRAAKQAGKGCVRVADDARPRPPSGAADVRPAIAEGACISASTPPSTPTGGSASCTPSRSGTTPCYGSRPRRGAVGAPPSGRAAPPRCSEWLLAQACAEVAGLPDDRSTSRSACPPATSPPTASPTRSRPRSPRPGSPPARLILSFTEETLLTSSAGAACPSSRPPARTGVRLCLDNYGMGQSLFALLARVPLDVVRVDLAALAGPRRHRPGAAGARPIVRTTAGFGLRTRRRRDLDGRAARGRHRGRRHLAARPAAAARPLGRRRRRPARDPGDRHPLTPGLPAAIRCGRGG